MFSIYLFIYVFEIHDWRTLGLLKPSDVHTNTCIHDRERCKWKTKKKH